MNKQSLCPNCKQYIAVSNKNTAWIIVITCFTIAILLFWLPIISIPALIVGGVFVVIGIANWFNSKQYYCMKCRHKWEAKELAE